MLARYGSSGSDVTRIQRELKAAGFNPGPIDGDFGPRTKSAVVAYQKKYHLTVDGIVGPQTWGKMLTDGFDPAGTRPGGTGGTGGVGGTTPPSSNKVATMLNEARSHLGYHEGAGNKNMFSSAMGRPAEAWCADFVSYCYTKAGKKLNEPYTPTLLSMLHQNGTYHRSNPKPGDIVMFDWNRGDRTSAMHTGLVERVYKSGGQWWVQTIEGNSSNSVKRNDYPVSDPNIVGFGTMG